MGAPNAVSASGQNLPQKCAGVTRRSGLGLPTPAAPEPCTERQMLAVVNRVAGMGFALLDAELRFLELNPYLARLLDSSSEDMLGRSALEFTCESVRSSAARALASVLESGLRVTGKWPFLCPSGRQRMARVYCERVAGPGSQPLVFCVISDVTAERNAQLLQQAQAAVLREVSLNRPLSEILAHVGEAVRQQRPEASVLITHFRDDSLDLEYATSPDAALQARIRARPGRCPCGPQEPVAVASCGRGAREAAVASCGRGAREAVIRTRLPARERSLGLGSIWTYPLRDDNGTTLGTLCLLLERTVRPDAAESAFLEQMAAVAGFALARQDALEDLDQKAHRDPLTGLANRALLMDRLQQLLQIARNGHHTGMLMLDLDDFKSVNDTHGHDAGDRLLAEVAGRLRTALRESDTVARLGGDEFVVLLPDSGPESAVQVARKLIAALQLPVCIDGAQLAASPSIGVALAAPGDTVQAALLRRADSAMYQAKLAGKGTWRLAPEAAVGEAEAGPAV